MRKKVCISGCIILIICVVITTQIFKPNTINKKTKNQIENNISLYLANNENFKSEIPENIDIKFDKKADIYIVTVSFENTSKKMNIFVSKDSTILNSSNN
jgi:hypothetical protein